MAYKYGVSGSFWYAAGATIQILLFSVLAVKVKQNAPRCHTFLEIIQRRYGVTVHFLYMFFAVATNLLVSTQLLLGGSAVVNALTGVNTYASNILIPLGVVVYVVLGGLRATFLCDYSHTLILMFIILYFSISAFGTSSKLGSAGAVYDLLVIAGKETPVAGNQDGSYVTLKSNLGLIFGVINICANSGTVFLDQGYWQRAIASRPSTAMRGYLLGGLAWFAVPFCFATTLGMVALALRNDPDYPTYPNFLTSDQVGAGLPAPAAAYTLLGTGGAVAMLIVLFMAVTSALSSELIAVSSILTFDVYKIYINPTAKGSTLVRMSHIGIVIWACVTAAGACLWNGIGLDLGWLYNFMGIIIGPAVVPVFYTVVWKKTPKIAMIVAPIVGLISGVVAWLVTAATLNDSKINIDTTGTIYAQLAGNLTSICIGAIISSAMTLIWPTDYDFANTRSINTETARYHHESKINNSSKQQTTGTVTNADEKMSAESSLPEDKEAGEISDADIDEEEDPVALRRASKTAVIAGTSLTAILVLVIPLPLFFTHYVFSKGFFTGWIVVGILWAFVGTFITVVLPLWESSADMARVARGIMADMRGKRVADRTS